jgi:hypothetical protein
VLDPLITSNMDHIRTQCLHFIGKRMFWKVSAKISQDELAPGFPEIPVPNPYFPLNLEVIDMYIQYLCMIT